MDFSLIKVKNEKVIFTINDYLYDFDACGLVDGYYSFLFSDNDENEYELHYLGLEQHYDNDAEVISIFIEQMVEPDKQYDDDIYYALENDENIQTVFVLTDDSSGKSVIYLPNDKTEEFFNPFEFNKVGWWVCTAIVDYELDAVGFKSWKLFTEDISLTYKQVKELYEND